jgi:hypothetical protein
MHASSRRGKPSKPRVLYVFRTPPGIKLGREPFDESIRREIETQHPDVHFDWVKLSKIPVPSPDVEYWRERRRAEKAAKQARREAEREDSQADAQDGAESSPDPESPAALDSDGPDFEPSDNSAADEPTLEGFGPLDDEFGSVGSEGDAPVDGRTVGDEVAGSLQPDGPSGEAALAARRRRRRRGGRRRHKRPPLAASNAAEPRREDGDPGTEPDPAPDSASAPSKVPEDPSKEA